MTERISVGASMRCKVCNKYLPDRCTCPKAAEPASETAAGAADPRHVLIAKVRALATGLAEQQAMPDDWWKPHLADIITSLATPPAAPPAGISPAALEREPSDEQIRDLLRVAEKCGAVVNRPVVTFHREDHLQAFASTVQGEPSEWRPIETAPSDVLVIVGWRDESDSESPDRHMFDYLEEGVWQNYFNEHEHYAIAGVASGNSEDAPYTHWMPMRAIPGRAALSQGDVSGEGGEREA